MSARKQKEPVGDPMKFSEFRFAVQAWTELDAVAQKLFDLRHRTVFSSGDLDKAIEEVQRAREALGERISARRMPPPTKLSGLLS